MKRFAVACSALVFLGSVASAYGGARILSPYRSLIGANNLRRSAAHAGVDFGEVHGAPVLAAADGTVVGVTNSPTGCGIGVLLAHQPFDRYTVYCHMETALVSSGQTVRRGDVIGHVGATGNAMGVPHVHLELCTRPCSSGHRDGDLRGTKDPLAISVGCFNPATLYPTGRLLLTYPVRCSD